jgi:hypothetical protein
MKIIAIAHRNEKYTAEDFAPHLGAEASHVLKLFAAERLREIYSRADGKGAILVLEADNEQNAREIVGDLPLAKLGMISFDIYVTKPYRGFIANIK